MLKLNTECNQLAARGSTVLAFIRLTTGALRFDQAREVAAYL
jgi:hypothetical protein